MAMVSDEKTAGVVEAARAAGATGATIITSVRGEGLKPEKTFLGLDLSGHRDVVLFLVAAPRARVILETIAAAGKFDEEPGAGVAFQIPIEDAVGLKTQLPTLLHEIEEAI
jgi:nitrogen regulatory protein PII